MAATGKLDSAEAHSAANDQATCPACGSSQTIPCFIEGLEGSEDYGKQRLCLACRMVFTITSNVYIHAETDKTIASVRGKPAKNSLKKGEGKH
jgi:hypothetical protein